MTDKDVKLLVERAARAAPGGEFVCFATRP
jgi:hypothetical protein